MFSHHITQFEKSDSQWRTPAHVREHERAIALSELAQDHNAFSEAIRSDVRTARSMLKLEPAVALPF